MTKHFFRTRVGTLSRRVWEMPARCFSAVVGAMIISETHLKVIEQILYLQGNRHTAGSGCSVARYRVSMGCWRSQVRILPSRHQGPSNRFKTL